VKAKGNGGRKKGKMWNDCCTCDMCRVTLRVNSYRFLEVIWLSAFHGAVRGGFKMFTESLYVREIQKRKIIEATFPSK
jgi:hypothetical protein